MIITNEKDIILRICEHFDLSIPEDHIEVLEDGKYYLYFSDEDVYTYEVIEIEVQKTDNAFKVDGWYEYKVYNNYKTIFKQTSDVGEVTTLIPNRLHIEFKFNVRDENDLNRIEVLIQKAMDAFVKIGS